ncbi:MAG: hypothetical protein ABFR31_02755 [Thermodesulfobacteriota bacterium]
MTSEYMVLFVNVENGEVEEVYGSNQLGKVASEDKAEEIIDSKRLPNLSDVQHIGSITTLYATFSPGCRYIRIGGKWVKVCR